MTCLSRIRAEMTPGRMFARAWERSSPSTTGRPLVSAGPVVDRRYSPSVARRRPAAVMSPEGAEWSAPYIASRGPFGCQGRMVEVNASSRSASPSGGPVNRATALPYPPGRYWVRMTVPSAPFQANASRSTDRGTPRHRQATGSPARARICGIWAQCPNWSGRYPTSMAPPSSRAPRRPYSRLRIRVSPEHRNSSARMVQGPAAKRPSVTNRVRSARRSGRISR